MLKMGHAHQSQNELVQKLQDKAQKTRKLEETCRNQERVIQRMEQLMQKSQPGKKGAYTQFASSLIGLLLIRRSVSL